MVQFLAATNGKVIHANVASLSNFCFAIAAKQLRGQGCWIALHHAFHALDFGGIQAKDAD